MKTLLRCFLLSFGLAALAGCCANNTCNCQDLPEDAIYFQLNQDPLRGKVFSDTDIDTVYLLRYSKARPLSKRATDSIALRRPLRRNSAYLPRLARLNPRDTTSLVILSNTSPFPASGPTRKLSDFGYALLVAPYERGRPRARYVLALDSVQLRGQFKGDGCCSCYQNTAKRVFLTGKPAASPEDLTETGGTPQPLLFKRP